MIYQVVNIVVKVVNKNIRFKTSLLRSDLCNYSDAYIPVKGRKNDRAIANINVDKKDVTFKNNAPFRI